ncbi:MAG TPA: protein-methionine-sulfoxide reductase heme-binding subunit MsrQ [Methylophilus sp.]
MLTHLNTASPQQFVRWFKRLIWLGACLPIARLFYLGLTDGLGANPVEFVERSTGTWGLVFLLLTLSMTPLKTLTQQAWWLALRRLLGLWMFAYACLHLWCYLWLDYQFDWQEISQDILKHPYVLVGVSALLLTLPLALTSNQAAIRKLKQRWKRLHQLVYLIAPLVLLHFWWLVKKDLTEPIVYSLLFALLMGLRHPALKHR